MFSELPSDTDTDTPGLKPFRAQCLFIIGPSLTVNHFFLTSYLVLKQDVYHFLIFQLTFLDMIMYAIFKEAHLPVHTTRWTRVFRPLFLVNISEGRHVRVNHFSF